MLQVTLSLHWGEKWGVNNITKQTLPYGGALSSYTLLISVGLEAVSPE